MFCDFIDLRSIFRLVPKVGPSSSRRGCGYAAHRLQERFGSNKLHCDLILLICRQ